ncbi:MAG: hypothetical protein K0B16_10360 [Burkholderiaceae bacterium]|nr:hypothetical protein [Burkholderiaceae bacterium]
MQLRVLPAKSGWRWVASGFLLLRRQPVALLALNFLNLVLLTFSSMVPVVGTMLPMALSTVFAVGLMSAMRAADSGVMPTPWMLFDGFRADGGRAWKPLLVLGVINAVATLGALTLSSLTDGGVLLHLAAGTIASQPARPAEGMEMVGAILLFLLAYTPVQTAMWYAPLFVAWHGMNVPKALFFSFVAVLRNLRAFFIYATGWFALVVALSLLIQMLVSAMGSSALLLSWVLSPVSLIVLSALYCSFWATYRDVVAEDQPPEVEQEN